MADATVAAGVPRRTRPDAPADVDADLAGEAGSGALYRTSPQVAVVGFGGSYTVLRATDVHTAVVLRSPSSATLDLLTYFRQPRSLRSWLARWAPERRPAASASLRHAVDRGLLTADGSAEGAGGNLGPATDDVLAGLLAEVVRLRARLAARPVDTDAAAPRAVDTGPATRSATVPPVPPAPALLVPTLYFLVRDAADRLAAAECQRTTRQAAALTGTGAAGAALRLHLGCGEHRLPGWVNVDLYHEAADLRADVRLGLPFDDGAAGAIYLAHLLEHLEYPVEALDVLRECRRVLGDGGLLRVVVPDIRSFLVAYVDNDAEFFRRFEQHWERAPAPTLLASFLHYAGAGEFPWVADRHRFGYDEPTLTDLLHTAGFTVVRRCTAGDSPIADPALDYSWANELTVSDRPLSLIMEAEVARR